MNWINMKYKLPPVDEDVLIYCDRITIGYLDVWTGQTFICEEATYSINEVTHWMPLPNIPE